MFFINVESWILFKNNSLSLIKVFNKLTTLVSLSLENTFCKAVNDTWTTLFKSVWAEAFDNSSSDLFKNGEIRFNCLSTGFNTESSAPTRPFFIVNSFK